MEKKKMAIYSIVALAALALLVVGATYAYFQNQYGSASNADVKVTTYTTDVLTFETGSNISITAGQDDFASGKGNKTGQTFARATLQANNKTNTATANYYMYLNIETNTFTYTNTDKPELVLQVINKTTGKPVTSITGLNYVTVTDGKNISISGFDITTKNGLIALFSNKEISASPKTIEEYTITITLVNHNFDQNINTGKNFNAKLMIQKEKEKETISMVCSNGQKLSDCIKSMNGKDETLYYHGSSLENGAGDNSYRFAGASNVVNNYVCFGSDESSCPVDNLYRIIGVFDGRVKLIKADYAVSALLGIDGDYKEIYSGDLSNYKGNLSTTNIGGYMWNYNGLSDKTINHGYGSNSWGASSLNKVNLNTNYLSNIGSKWANMIDTNTWKVGGNHYSAIRDAVPSVVYQNEMVKPQYNTTYEAKIGLMYVSDYGFAAVPSVWTTKLSSYDDSLITSNNWLFLGLMEWIITPDTEHQSGYTFLVYFINNTGFLSQTPAKDAYSLRPTFYLNSSIKYSSGSGTKDDPIRIDM